MDTAHSIESDSTADAVVIRGVKLPLTDLSTATHSALKRWQSFSVVCGQRSRFHTS